MFDVVYTANGVLGWLPDLRRWGEVVAHFLAPGGVFYVFEAHPFLWVFDDETDQRELRVRYPYFEQDEPLRSEYDGSYAVPDAAVRSVEFGWIHSLGDIVGALLRAGLRLEFLHEHDFLAWQFARFFERDDQGRWRLPRDMPSLPGSFSLRAVKP